MELFLRSTVRHCRTCILLLFVLALFGLAGCGSGSGGGPDGALQNSQTGDVSLSAEDQGTAISPPRLTSGSKGDKPIAIPGAFPTSGQAPKTIKFFDNGSYDPDGQIVKWEWNFGDQGGGKDGWYDYTSTSGIAFHLYSSPGTYNAQLQVTDNDGNEDKEKIKITITSVGNLNPVADGHAAPVAGNAPLIAAFDAIGSSDPDGTIVTWEWDLFGNGTFVDYTSTEGAANCIYTIYGTYNPVLRVTDDNLAMGTKVFEINVNGLPIAVATADPGSGDAPLPVNFKPTGSYDPDGTIVKHEWDFGEGDGFEEVIGAGGEASHTYNSAGSYTVQLRVTDDKGAIDTDSVAIEVTAPQIADDWWMFGHDSKHSRRSRFVGPATNLLKWSFAAGFDFTSSPAIGKDGTVYIGNTDGKLYAVSSDGTLKWTYVTTAGIQFSSPAIGGDGAVYVGDMAGKVYAINSDGSLKWSYTSDAGGYIYSSPAIGGDGTVYVGISAVLFGELCAINPDGTLKWSYSTNSYGYIFSSPAIGEDGTVYVGSGTDFSGRLWAINPDGSLKWSYAADLYCYFLSSPAIGADGTVYVGNVDCKLRAINPDGTLKWSFATQGPVTSSPAIGQDGTVYVGSDDGRLYAINPDGTLKWSYATLGRISYSSPAVGGDGTVYVGNASNQFYAINPEGTLKWLYSAPALYSWNVMYSSPAIGADGTVYMGSMEIYTGGKLYAFGPGGGA